MDIQQFIDFFLNICPFIYRFILPILIIIPFILIISILIYLINIQKFINGIKKIYLVALNKNISIPISIIVAVKNGEENILRLLDALTNQIYKGDMEFIIVDDQSTDNTKKIIQTYSNNDSRFKYVSSELGSNTLNHKKKALDAGINNAEYEYLLFTDIDCIIQEKWAASMASCFVKNIDYIIGYTYVKDQKNIVNQFQRIDLFMLLFSSYSSTVNGFPWASSGQNQAYTKTLYNNLNGFEKLAAYLQGDDTLFLQLAASSGANVVFNTSPESYVISRSEKSWINLLYQRARWAGDANVMWKFNLFFYLMALSTFLINLAIVVSLFLSIKATFLIILIKLLFEIRLYRLGSIKFKHKMNYRDFMIWSAIVPVYTILMGFASCFNVTWKGKPIK